MPRSTVHVDVPVAVDAMHGHDELRVEAHFDIPIHNKRRVMAITGIVFFVAGFIALVVMGGFFIAGFPENWYPTENAQGDIINEAELQDLQELVGILSLIAVPLFFLGLTFYTFGRAYRGDEDVEAIARDAEVA